jgi:hypothetical protein
MSPVTIGEALSAHPVGRPTSPPPQMAPPTEPQTGSMRTAWSRARDAAFAKITETSAGDGSADNTARLASTVSAGGDPAAEIDKVLADLLVAESWERMAMRSVARWEPQHRNLVPGPVAAQRRVA